MPLKIALSLIVDDLLSGQLAVPNFERDDGTLEKKVMSGKLFL